VDKLLAAQSEVYASEGIPFEPRWTSTFSLLEQEGSLTVTEIAGRLRLSHPAVIKLTNAMITVGLLSDADDEHDQRRRILRLTSRGRRLAPQLHRIWEALSAAHTEVFLRAGCNVLEMLERVENQIIRTPIVELVHSHLHEESLK
jgi:DNA-binding MarR family transcriptional regulator